MFMYTTHQAQCLPCYHYSAGIQLPAFFAMLQLHWNAVRNSRPFRSIPNTLKHFPLTIYMFHIYIKPNRHSAVGTIFKKTLQTNKETLDSACYTVPHALHPPLKRFHQSINSTHFSNCILLLVKYENTN